LQSAAGGIWPIEARKEQRMSRIDANDPWKGVNPFDPAFRIDPYAALAALREHHPVDRSPVGIWRICRYADCVRLLREVPSGVRRADGSHRSDGAFPPDLGPGRFMLQQDPPNHTRLRKLVAKAFTPRAVSALRAHVQALADRLVDEALERGELDVIADLALPVPSTVICEMMGVPSADRARFTDCTARATHLLGAPFIPQERLDKGAAAARALHDYFTELIADRRATPRDDMLTDLVRATDEEDRLSPGELLTQVTGLLIAGFETTIGLIGNGMLQLVRHPDELARLRSNPDLIDGAVEECLRFDGPIMLTVRVLREDTEFGGVTIPADSEVMVLLAAANRDPEAFPDPDRFDIAREPNEHLAFGGGHHLCLGAHLARLEAQVAIGTLVRRTLELELPDTRLEHGASLFRVLARLPLRVKAA
jgi:cytochrome P450